MAKPLTNNVDRNSEGGGSRNVAADAEDSRSAEKVRLAVFDIDGTTIDGQSPAIVTLNLFADGLMNLGSALKAGIWGIKYKAGMTTETTEVRQRVFKTFTKMPADKANQILEGIYKKRVAPKLRAKAIEQIRWHQKRGDVVVFISASFDHIAQLLADDTGVGRQSSTKMEVKNGCYTGKVEGLPVEGDEKPVRLTQYADAEFGAGNWELDYSYADHETDIPILEMAEHPVAVNPKHGLEVAARERGWTIVEW